MKRLRGKGRAGNGIPKETLRSSTTHIARGPKSKPLMPAIFLDRDGTLIEEVGYVNHLDRARLFPWAAEAVRKLNRTGWPVIVVTNQSGVARGLFDEKLVRQVHRKIARELRSQGARILAFYYCPHHPEAPIRKYRKNCSCRKPATGLLDVAAKDFGLDLRRSYVIGDSYRDIQMGANAGAKTIMVMTGYGLGEYTYHRRRWPKMPDRIAKSLREAAQTIANHEL